MDVGGFGSPFGGIWDLFPVFFFIVFAVIIIAILFSVFKGVSQWSHNNKQPVLSVDARLIGKRTDVRHRHNTHDGHMHSHADTTYYVTFEVESGDRLEFRVAGNEYGQLAEGDTGKLTFQGTRYLGFQRDMKRGYV